MWLYVECGGQWSNEKSIPVVSRCRGADGGWLRGLYLVAWPVDGIPAEIRVDHLGTRRNPNLCHPPLASLRRLTRAAACGVYVQVRGVVVVETFQINLCMLETP